MNIETKLLKAVASFAARDETREGAGIHLASEWSQPWRLTIEKAPARATVLIMPRRGGR